MSSVTDTGGAPLRPGKGRRRFQILIGVAIALCLLWTGGWFALRHYVGGRIDGLEAHAAAEGATLACGDRSIGGFPFRFDVTCMPLAAACPADIPCSIRPEASIQLGTATIIPIHRAAK